MKNKQKIFLLLFILSLIMVSVPYSPVSASSMTIASMTNIDNLGEVNNLQNLHPSSTAAVSAIGQNFKPTVDSYLNVVTFYIGRFNTSAISGTVSMKLYSAQNVSDTPSDGELLETSTSTFLTNDITATSGYYTFQFSGSTQVLSTNYYSVVIYISEAGLIDSSNYVKVQMNNGNYYTDGHFISYFSSAWSASISVDNYFQIIGSTTSSATPTPTPAPTPTPTPSGLGPDDEYYWNGTAWVPVDNIVETTTDLILPLLIPLIVIIICAGLGAYFVGLWGFVLGLDVAIVLLYVALPTYMPLWGVLIVAVGNVIVLLMGRR